MANSKVPPGAAILLDFGFPQKSYVLSTATS